MNNLIEIAKANGAVNGNDWDGHWTDSDNIILDSEQLRATFEQVCAPLVKILGEVVHGISRNSEDPMEWPGVREAHDLIATYRTIIGDKE